MEQAQPDILDINFGCPVKRVAGKGAGAGMLQNIPQMLELTRAVVDAVKIPVTVKTRLGWDANNKIIVELAEQLQDCEMCIRDRLYILPTVCCTMTVFCAKSTSSHFKAQTSPILIPVPVSYTHLDVYKRQIYS